MATSVGEPPSILDRVDRLDALLGYLERRESRVAVVAKSPRASTTSSGTVTTSDGGNSSVNSSPKCLARRRCRPVHDVMMEVQTKGNIIDRVDQLEYRLLKLEEEIEYEKKREEEYRSPRSGDKRKHGKGLKSLVKSCVKGNLKTKGTE